MRRILISTTSLLALSAASAFAADIPRPAPVYKAPAYVAPMYNWSGAYIGINGGYAWGNSSWDGLFGGSAKVSGGLVGATLGYNWQMAGSPLVLGIEGDIDWTNIRGSFTNAVCVGGCQTQNNWLGTVRARAGYAIDRFMPYVTGGLAVGDIQVNPPVLGGTNATKAGWTAGAGVEAMIAPNWTAKLEYLYVDLGSTGCGVGACGLPTNVNFHTNIVRAGLNFKF